MEGLSAQIESGLDTVLEGLNYDIGIDYMIRDSNEYKNYIGYNIITSTLKSKFKGKLEKVSDKGITISYYIKKDKERVNKKITLSFSKVLESRVYEEDSDLLEADKMKAIIDSKISSFSLAKQMLNKWVSSPNSPTEKKQRYYIEEIIKSGEKALSFLRETLAHDIDYDEIEKHKISAAIKAKPIILNGIFELDANLIELRNKLEANDLSLSEREFTLGYPELYAKGKFINRDHYYKKVLNNNGAVIIDPFSTEGKKITLDDLDIILPKIPNKSDILFNDLPKSKQFWKRPDIPNITISNIDNHKDFIIREFKRRIEGVWFYNNGVPTYLTGNHYFALVYGKMLDNGGYMDYREAQRDLFYFMEACLVDYRSLGMLFGKSRRTGFTYAAIMAILNFATMTANAKNGLMSKSGTDGGEAFAKISYAFLNLPFWIRPIVRGKLDSPKELYFGQPFDNSKEKKKTKSINMDEYLNTSMDWRNTKNGSYDSIKLNRYLLDEIFKIESPNDVVVHLSMVTPTMMPNGDVVGKMLAGSTMGVHSKGGLQGIELINNSKVTLRDPDTEKTPTGLYFHFLPAHKNMEAFTDKYGKCWDKPLTKKILNVKGKPIKMMGAEQYLIAIEQQKKKQSDKAYNEQIRTYPRTLEHMMRDDSTESVFNMEKLLEQSEYNAKIPEESRYTVGNFDWVDGVEDGDVVFNPNSKGRFKVSWMPSIIDGTEGLANRVREVNGKFFPLNKQCVRIGVDPFSLKSTHGEGSKGAAHGLTIIFPEGGAPSNKFVFEYLARPSDETIFFEDMIKVMRYYGAPVLVESNRIDLLRHMRNRGYRGFAMDRLDRPKHKLNPNEIEYGGQVMSGKDILDSHMNAIGAWIEKYIGVYTNELEKLRPIGEMGDMPFNNTLKDWLGFDPDDRTKFDATISSGLAVMACQTEKYKGKRIKKDRTKIVLPLLRTYSNKSNLSGSIG